MRFRVMNRVLRITGHPVFLGLAVFGVLLLGSGMSGLDQVLAQTAPSATKTLYTCGMDPEIISDEPGDCPKCQMKLTPMDPDRARMILEARGEIVPEEPATPGERKIKYWRAPMDPAYIRNEPGKSPMGMDLVPVYEDEVAGGPTIRIDPVTEQNMGLRYDVVRLGPLEKTIRTVGTIDYDEQSLGTVTTKVDGWVEEVHIDETGTQVHQGDPLFEFYSPQLYSAQEEFLVALRDTGNAASDSAGAMARTRLQSARDRLSFFDISEAQIEELEQTGTIRKTLTITAKITGIVTHRNVVEGEMLKAGAPAYQIADLSNVWVIGKVYQSDLAHIQLGQEALMKMDYLPGRTYSGRLTYIYPYLEPGTREVSVRMEFHNPGYELKPGMFATLRIFSRVAEQAVLVPSAAVIDTGERKVAFVTTDPGKFEPRRIETGLRTNGGEIQVLSGLAPGERVVVSGQFLLDSESRLREATLKMINPGMMSTTEASPSPGAMTHDHMTGTGTAGDGSARPGEGSLQYVCPMPSHADIYYDHPGDCPLCNMKMVPVSASTVRTRRIIDHYTCPMPEHYEVAEPGPGKCPLCGMTLIPVTQSELERFRGAGESAPRPLYTCPMPSHAHVISDTPGDCPECGMKFVPTEAVPHGAQARAAWEADQATSTTASGMPALYTCPMASHAHVVSEEPGRCPECNMVVVPTSEVAHGAEAEQAWASKQSAQ